MALWATMKQPTGSSPTPSVRFRGKIEINGINPYILVDAKRARKLKPGWRKPLPVRIQINGQPETPWRINMMPIGDGSFYLYLHEQVRKASGTGVGDVVEVEARFDEEYRGGPDHPMPAWFGDALDRDEGARRGWEALSPSRKKEILRYFDRLKSAEAKARNLETALQVLAGANIRFMARDWNTKRGP